jgi:DNA-binding CsgD family transcriptional regulator
MRRPPVTARQEQVLKLLLRGYTADEIAARLRITRATVAYHRRNLLKAFQARRLSQLVIQAHRFGY